VRLTDLSQAEWDDLCDGCGKCCLLKYKDTPTTVACKWLDLGTCQCSDFEHRKFNYPDCVQLTRDNIKTSSLPTSCAYRRVDEGRPLAWWHHLKSGSRDTIHEAGMSVRGKVVSEDSIKDMEKFWNAGFVRNFEGK
jgi:uncharacterized protein